MQLSANDTGLPEGMLIHHVRLAPRSDHLSKAMKMASAHVERNVLLAS